MKKPIALFLALLTFACFGSAVFADDNAKAQAVADTSAVAPGKPFMLGIKFTIEPGWHIYWKNPGDSGLATEVKLNLPEGFTAGELQFPVPSRLELAGNIVNYAYEDEVMLMVRITPPGNLPAGSIVKISAKASWLVCKDDCVPGKADLSLELPVADNAAAANVDLFKQWESLLPVKEDADDISGTSSSLSLANGDGQAVVSVSWKKHAGDAQFIPAPLKSGDISNIKTVTTGDSTKITFDIKGYKSTDPITGLLTFTSAAGAKTGVEISISSGAGN